jgi:hypothetical protein
VRIRPLAALSAAALTAILLAGCSGAPEGSGTPTPDASSATDLCSVAAPEGDVASSVTVSGEVGESATAEFETPLEIESAERAIVVEGDGTEIQDGDYVSYALAVFDATSGESLQSGGFGGAALPAMAITIGSGADQFFGCSAEGSRIVMTVPADEWCAATEPGADFPTVEFSAEGVPTITIPASEPPAEVQLEVLEEGDGDVVEPGDSVTVNYTGMKWSDSTVFDSSWDRGEPAEFQTTGVVAGFQRALEGQTVGSKVLVSMPPACGYGEDPAGHELGGPPLVFVVDILETKPAEQ